jgi:DNA topoisomerase-6 subunit A
MREQLRFFPEEHGGSVAGELTVIDVDPETKRRLEVDCRRLGSGSYSIPRSVEHLQFESGARFILAVETGGMFQRLNAHRFWQEERSILVEMAGVPTRATRRFVRRLSDALALPVYCFSDCDPYGFANIYRTLKVGSGNAAHVNRFFSVPQARFLGVTPDDIEEFGLQDATHPLEPNDVKRAEDALRRDPFFMAEPRWQAALRKLIEMGVRAEQQALAKWGLNYVLDEYLPRKLSTPESFLP